MKNLNMKLVAIVAIVAGCLAAMKFVRARFGSMGEMVDTVRDGPRVRDAMHSAEDAMHSAEDFARTAAHKTSEHVRDAAHNARDAAEEARDAVSQKVSSAKSDADAAMK